MHGKLRDELLDREVFDTLWESEVFVERWRWEYNTVRLHSALGYRPLAPETVEEGMLGSGATLLRPTSLLASVS